MATEEMDVFARARLFLKQARFAEYGYTIVDPRVVRVEEDPPDTQQEKTDRTKSA